MYDFVPELLDLKESTINGDFDSAKKLVDLYESEKIYKSPYLTAIYNGYRVLYNAIKNNHRDIFMLLMNSKRFIQSTTICDKNRHYIISLLRIAVTNNDIDLVDMLLKKTPYMYLNKHGVNFVYEAVKKENMELLKTFMKYFSNFHGKFYNLTDKFEGSIAYYIFKSDNVNLMDLFKNKNFINESVLTMAIFNNDLTSVKKLLAMGVDIYKIKSSDLEKEKWYAILCSAIKENDNEMIKILSKREEINLSYEDIVGKGLFVLAYENNNLSMFLYLVYYTQMSSDSLFFDTPDNEHPLLYLAVQSDNFKACSLILHKYYSIQDGVKYIDYRMFGNFICSEEEIKKSVFQLAIEKGNETIIELFKSKKKELDYNIEHYDSIMYSSLHRALMKNDDELLREVLSKYDEIKLKYEDIVGKKPLIVAYESKNLELIEKWMGFEDICDLYPNYSGDNNPLIYRAAEEGEFEILKLYVKHFRSSCWRNIYSSTTLTVWYDLLYFALTKNNDKLIRELSKLNELNLNYKDIVGKKPLLVAYESKNLTMLKQFIDMDPTRVNDLFPDKDGNERTLLYFAIQNGNVKICELLLRPLNKMKLQGDGHLNLFHLAIENGDAKIFKLLLETFDEMKFQRDEHLNLFRLAFEKENNEIVRLILESFIKKNDGNFEDYAEFIESTFDLAQKKNDLEIIKLFSKITISRLKFMSDVKNTEFITKKYSDNDLSQFFYKFIMPQNQISDDTPEERYNRNKTLSMTNFFFLVAITCGYKNSVKVALKNLPAIPDKTWYDIWLSQVITLNHIDILISLLLYYTRIEDVSAVDLAIRKKRYQCLSILLDFNYKYVDTPHKTLSLSEGISNSSENKFNSLIKKIVFKCTKSDTFDEIHFDKIEEIFIKFILKRHLAKLPIVDEDVYEEVQAHPKSDSIIQELKKEIDSMENHMIENTNVTFKDIFTSLSNQRLPSKYRQNSAIIKTFKSQEWYSYFPNYCYVLNYFFRDKIINDSKYEILSQIENEGNSQNIRLMQWILYNEYLPATEDPFLRLPSD